MTIAATPRKAGPFSGTGSTTTYPFDFKVFAASDIKVTAATAGVERVLALGADYTVNLNANQDTSPGGAVVCLLPGTDTLTVTGQLPLDQPLDLPSGGNFSPLALENELDRVVMQIQQLDEASDRTLRLPVSTANVDSTLPPPEATKFLAWNASGTALENVRPDDTVSSILYAEIRHQTFTGTGSETTFSLDYPPASLSGTEVSVDGLVYVPGTDFDLSGTALSFTTAPSIGAEIFVRYGRAAGTEPVSTTAYRIVATEGQTAFTLAGGYPSGVNALSVYVNGLRMETGGVDFTETDSTTVTFASGLAAGDSVVFVIGLESAGGVSGGASSWDEISGKPSTFPPSTHTHAIENVTGLQTALNGKQATLSSGVNIKTVNGTSLLGSGNLVISGSGASAAADVAFTPAGGISATNVQAAIQELDTEKQANLVSGTNIKTVNGTSLLGSGNIVISGGGSSPVAYLTDFGAVGDGNPASATLNNTAITDALAYMASTGNNVHVPPGVYVCNPFTINNTAYLSQAMFVGTDRERCVFKRNGTGAGAFVTVGSASGTVFQSGVGMLSMKIDGGATTNGPAFQAYDMVRSRFENCQFTGGSIACSLLGGISLTFASCLFEAATIGVKIDKFTSSAGGGWPNAIHFDGGEIVDNTELGLWFDGGRMVTLSKIDVEGNGTTLGASQQGGVWVGTNIGQEVIVNDTFSIGLIVESCWFEANRGYADIHANSGNTSVSRTTFFSTASQSTYDVRVDGGQYSLRDVNCSFLKTQNVFEGSGTIAGNVIVGSQIPNISYTTTKTTVFASNRVFTNGGEATTGVISQPLIQSGVDFNASGTTITFPQPYATTPAIVASPWGGATNELLSVKITSASATGFQLHKSYSEMLDADTSTGNILADSPYTVVWLAFGTRA